MSPEVTQTSQPSLENIPVGVLSLQDLICIAMAFHTLPVGFGDHLKYVAPIASQTHSPQEASSPSQSSLKARAPKNLG